MSTWRVIEITEVEADWDWDSEQTLTDSSTEKRTISWRAERLS